MKGIIRYIASLVLCAALCASLYGCSCSGADSTGGQQSVTPSSQHQTVSTQSGSTEYTLGETVIFSSDECAFAVTSVDPDGLMGFTVNVRCENKGSRTLMFSWDECSVNGWMLDPFWAQEVTAGNRANSQISFSRSELERCGIRTVDEIEFELHIYDSDDWEANAVSDDEYAIYPTGLMPSQVEVPDRVSRDGEQVIVDDGQCAFIIESIDTNGLMGYTLMCYLENRTDDALMFSWDDVAVNGVMTDPFWAAEVEAGKRAYAQITFTDSSFEENGIDNVEQIEFRLRVYDSDDWFDEPAADGVFVYTP